MFTSMARPNNSSRRSSYPLSDSLTTGKRQVTVRFQALPGNFAGGVFGVRVAKRR